MIGHRAQTHGTSSPRHRPRSGARPGLCWSLALALVLCLPAQANPPPRTQDSFTAAAGTSDVGIASRNDTWDTQWLQWDRRGSDDGLFVRAERLSRHSGSGTLGSVGGHWLDSRWIISGQVQLGSGPGFVPKRAAELNVAYRLDLGHALRVGYRQARYAGSILRLWSYSALLYRGNDEFELGMRRGELDTPQAQRIAYGLARGQWSCASRWNCGIRLAAGRNVFGADEPGFDTGSGWLAGAFVAYALLPRNSLRLDLDTGHANRFRQNAITLSYRHAFAH